MPKAPTNLSDFNALVEIVQTLRGPDGCPWDKEQTPTSLAPFAIEEVYELVSAIEEGDPMEIKEELGDVLFQVALHAQLANEKNHFNISEVLSTLNEKMIRRHPHVFANTEVKNIGEVWANWEQIKKQEKQKKSKSPSDIENPFSSIPKALPALQTAYKIGVKTEKLKFDWDHHTEVKAKVDEELMEVQEILDQADFEQKLIEKDPGTIKKLRHEIGDLLFAVTQLARHLDIEPEQSLRKANKRFETRFLEVLKLNKESQRDWDSLSLAEKETLWQQAKIRTASRE